VVEGEGDMVDSVYDRTLDTARYLKVRIDGETVVWDGGKWVSVCSGDGGDAFERLRESLGRRPEYVLDGVVHEAYASMASDTVNEGPIACAEFLISVGWTAEEILDRIELNREENE
jgi:hypothetical protein